MKNSRKNIMKLTIVILIVTIIILVGIIIKVLNTNNIINKQGVSEGKQLTETTKDNTYIDMQSHLSKINEEETKLLNFKSAIATAITNEGVRTSLTDTETTMAANIKSILQSKTSDATATAADILKGKTAYVNGELIIGSFNNSSKVVQGTIPTGTSGTYTVSSLDFAPNVGYVWYYTTSNYSVVGRIGGWCVAYWGTDGKTGAAITGYGKFTENGFSIPIQKGSLSSGGHYLVARI